MSSLISTTLELSLIGSLTVLGLYLSYFTLNVCDLSTDGCFTLGACTAAVVALSGHPFLAVPAAMLAGICSGYVTALLQFPIIRHHRQYRPLFYRHCDYGKLFLAQPE